MLSETLLFAPSLKRFIFLFDTIRNASLHINPRHNILGKWPLSIGTTQSFYPV